MNDTAELTFRDVTAPAAREEPATEIVAATIQATSQIAVDIEKVDLSTLAVAKFGKWREDAAEASKKAGAELDLSTATKCTEARSLRQRLVLAPTAAARKVATGLKRVLNDTKGKIEGELEQIVAEYERIDGLLLPRIESREAEIEAERLERARLEAERVAKHQASIAKIRGMVARCEIAGMTAARIATGIQMLQDQALTEAELQEFYPQALAAKVETLAAMNVLRVAAEASEAEAARVEAQRVENERVAAENARIAADLKRQADELAAQRAESDRLERLAQERREAAQREADALAKTRAAVAELPQGQATQQVLKAEPATADATDRDAPADASPPVGAMGAGQPADAGPVAGQTTQPAAHVPADQPGVSDNPAQPQPGLSHLSPGDAAVANPVAEGVSSPVDATGADVTEPATLKLGAICERLGFRLTRDFMEHQLGVHPHAFDGNSVLYRESQFLTICAALIAHIQKARAA